MKKMTPPQRTIIILMILVALCICAIVVIIIPAGSLPAEPANVPPSPSPTLAIIPTAPAALQHRSAGAIIQCRYFISDQLVSPSSAKFSREEAYKVKGEPANYHAVTGIVESQNRLGVMLRSEYRCDTHYLPDDPTLWVLDYLDIAD